MKTKKNTIILSGSAAVVNLLLLAFLQFRMYHLFGIKGNGDSIWGELRDFCIAISSGLFTSSCVTLIIAIREYYDALWSALRDLIRLLGELFEKFRGVNWYDPKIPSDLLYKYFRLKFRASKVSCTQTIEYFSEIGVEVPSIFVEQYNEERAIRYAFREHVWSNTSDIIRSYKSTDEEKSKYLDNEIPCCERAIQDGINHFFDSLKVFRSYNIYQLQASLDTISFFFSKYKKDTLSGIVINYVTTYVNAIKSELTNIESKPNDNMQLISSFILLNALLLKFNEDHSEAYSLPEFNIAKGCYYANIFLGAHKEFKFPNVESYNIYHTSRPSSCIDIVFDNN